MAYSQAHRLPLPTDPSSSTSHHTEPARLSFTVDQTKLNPAFEAYKLVQDDLSSSSLRSYGLPSRPPRLTQLYQPQQAKQSGKLTFVGLGYKETKERALHQVLIPSAGTRDKDDPFAAYIDANRFVVALSYDAMKDRVVGHPVYRLAAEDGGSVPSLASISATEWLASDGEIVVLVKLQKVKLGGDGSAVRWTSGQEKRWRLEGGGTVKCCRRLGDNIRVLVQRTKTVIATDGDRAKEGMQGLGFQQSTQQVAKNTSLDKPDRSGTMFEVQLVELESAETAASSRSEEPDTEQTVRDSTLLWTVQGEEPLIMVKLDEQEVMLGAEAPFAAVADKPAPSGISKQSKASTALDVAIVPQRPPSSHSRRPPPHFSWAQTTDTLTLAFALPSWITTAHIRAHFSLHALSLSLTQEALTLLAASASTSSITEIDTDAISTAPAVLDDDSTRAARMIASGRYVSRSTWGEIDPTGSVWTLERAKGVSVLTLHLEKKHEGTRWVQVFADRTRDRKRSRAEQGSATQTSFQQARSTFERAVNGQSSQPISEEEQGDEEDNEDDVPETMDPSELLNMLEGMDKYTVDEESSHGYGLDRAGLASSAGFSQNGGTNLSLDQPSLLKDNLEEEDANVGRPLVLTSIDLSSEMHVRSGQEASTVLATALPADSIEDLVMVKHDLDGAVFAASSGSWAHTATMPALAFVLASKRDAQRVHIHKRRKGHVVLAFESAPQVTGGSSGRNGNGIGGGAGNLFLYYSPASQAAKNASSRVVRLAGITAAEEDEEETKGGDGASGALLGVCSVRLPVVGDQGAGEWEDTLVCLCENRMLLLRGVL